MIEKEYKIVCNECDQVTLVVVPYTDNIPTSCPLCGAQVDIEEDVDEDDL